MNIIGAISKFKLHCSYKKTIIVFILIVRFYGQRIYFIIIFHISDLYCLFNSKYKIALIISHKLR